jgi:hypothetical protein
VENQSQRLTVDRKIFYAEIGQTPHNLLVLGSSPSGSIRLAALAHGRPANRLIADEIVPNREVGESNALSLPKGTRQDSQGVARSESLRSRFGICTA